jgi:hypothetical protein
MKKFFSLVVLTLVLLNLSSSVLNPVWCFESDGKVSLEWLANCVPDKDCNDCFDVQASATDQSIAQNLFLSANIPSLPVQKLWNVPAPQLKISESINIHAQPILADFFVLDSVILLI